jgi:hypothetical protein
MREAMEPKNAVQACGWPAAWRRAVNQSGEMRRKLLPTIG